jgi:hypothetical protein
MVRRATDKVSYATMRQGLVPRCSPWRADVSHGTTPGTASGRGPISGGRQLSRAAIEALPSQVCGLPSQHHPSRGCR